MKKVCFLFFMLIVFIGTSQVSGYVEYEYIKNLGIDYETTGALKFNALESQFIELSPNYETKVEQTVDGNIVATSYSNSEERPLIYINLKKDSLYDRQNLFKKIYTTKEAIPAINWKIVDEYKMIDKFKCQLAFGSFRGRNYKVWFTSDIPVTFGPWKLQGLPGLILEASDDKNAIIFNAKKVIIGLTTRIDNFATNDAIYLRTYIELKDDIYKEKEKTMATKVPRNGQFKFSMPGRKTQKEIIYEWEKREK